MYNRNRDFEARLRRMEQTVARLASAGRGPVVSTANVSNPPTDAELDSAFGTAANLYDGFVGLVDDAGSGSTVWFVCALNSQWWYEQLTAAV